MEDVVAESEHVEQARHPLQRMLDGRLDVEGEVLFGVGYLAAVAVGYGASTADQPAAEVVHEVDDDKGGSLDGQVMSIPQPATCFIQPTGVGVGGSGGAHFGAEPSRGPTPRAAQIAKNSRAKAEARRPWHDSQLAHGRRARSQDPGWSASTQDFSPGANRHRCLLRGYVRRPYLVMVQIEAEPTQVEAQVVYLAQQSVGHFAA